MARSGGREPHGHRTEAHLLAEAFDEITQIAVRQLIDPRAEQDEARRPRVHLGDIAELDPLAARHRRRIALDRVLEPAVELAGGNAPRPGLPHLDGRAEHLVKRSEEHTSELPSLMRNSYAVICLN